MNFLQKQLILGDGRTLAERLNAGEQLPGPRLMPVTPAPEPQQVTVEEFCHAMSVKGERSAG